MGVDEPTRSRGAAHPAPQITGLTSTTDFLDYLPSGNEYRKFSPG
jgi:hypothetical protein